MSSSQKQLILSPEVQQQIILKSQIRLLDMARMEVMQRVKFRTLCLFFCVITFGACTGSQVSPTSQTSSQYMSISVFPNQTLFVEATVYDNKFVDLRRVDSVSDQNITMTFRLFSTDGGKSMTLNVKNPFDSFVKYNIDMVDSKGLLHHTSSCPVLSRREVYEFWPHPIPELRISNFRFLEPGEKQGLCIY